MLPPIFFKVPQAGATGAPDRISLFGLLTFCICDLLFRAVGALRFSPFPLSLFPFFPLFFFFFWAPRVVPHPADEGLWALHREY